MTGSRQGFTLLELLVVIGLLAAVAGVVLSGLSGTQSTALQAGQTAVANLIALARVQAQGSGQPVRLLVHHDPASGLAAARYLRLLVLQQESGESWRTTHALLLPEGVYVAPHQSRTPAGLFGESGPWTKRDGTRLHSTCLAAAPITVAVDHAEAELWVGINFSAAGTTANSGFVVLGPGRRLMATAGDGALPVRLGTHDAVRGLQVSGYGLAVLIHERAGF